MDVALRCGGRVGGGCDMCASSSEMMGIRPTLTMEGVRLVDRREPERGLSPDMAFVSVVSYLEIRIPQCSSLTQPSLTNTRLQGKDGERVMGDGMKESQGPAIIHPQLGPSSGPRYRQAERWADFACRESPVDGSTSAEALAFVRAPLTGAGLEGGTEAARVRRGRREMSRQ